MTEEPDVLQVAELHRIQAEQAKIDAETTEIQRRLSRPWWYVPPLALIQAVIGGLVAGALLGSFLLDNFLKIYDLSQNAQAALEKEKEALGKEQAELKRQNSELQREQAQLIASNKNLSQQQARLDEQLTEVLQLNQKQQEEIVLLKQQREADLARAKQNLDAIAQTQPENAQPVAAAEAEVVEIQEKISQLETEERNAREREKELGQLVKSRLEDFQVQIRYGSAAARANAEKIAQLLESLDFNDVSLKQISASEREGSATENNPVLYFESTEASEARLLQEKIQSSFEISIQLQETQTESPRVLSVFLP